MNSALSAENLDNKAVTGRKTLHFSSFSPILWLYFLAAIHLIGPFLPVKSAQIAIAGGIFLTAIYIGAVVAFALGIARRRYSIPDALLWLGVSVAVWMAMEKGALPYVNRAFRLIFENGGTPTTSQQLLQSFTVTLQDLALFAGATFTGTLLSRLIRHANMIGPIGAAIALIDIWGVLFGGIVSQLLASKAARPITEKAMTTGPSMGSASRAQTGFSIDVPAIGIGDFLFIALLLSVLVNLAMNWRTSARLMWLFCCLALMTIAFHFSVPLPVHLFPLKMKSFPIDALPGLLFIGAAAVLPNWKFFTFTREEKFALLYAGILVLVLTIGLYFGFKVMLAAQ